MPKRSTKAANTKKPRRKVVATSPAASDVIEVPEGWTRLERIDAGRREFYQSKVERLRLQIAYGEIGTDGTAHTERFTDAYEAHAANAERLAEKQAEGFVRVVAGPRLPPDVGAHDDALEARVVEDRSDDSFEVYADWLQERGDIRGELASLQLRAKSSKSPGKLAARIEKLIWDHKTRLFGPFVPYIGRSPETVKNMYELPIEVTWRAGWFDTLSLGASARWNATTTGITTVNDVAELVALLPKCVSARLIHELVLTRTYRDLDFASAVDALVAALPSLPALRRLTIGVYDDERYDRSWTKIGKLAAHWPHLRRLEMLKLQAGTIDLEAIELPECRELHVETTGLTRNNLAAITKATFPKLEKLVLWFGDEDDGCDCKVEDLAPILDGQRLPRVKHLGLRDLRWADALAPALVSSKILPRLETLDVSMSDLTGTGIRTYTESAANLRHLRSIDMSKCLLDGAALALAKKLGNRVVLDQQGDRSHKNKFRYDDVDE